MSRRVLRLDSPAIGGPTYYLYRTALGAAWQAMVLRRRTDPARTGLRITRITPRQADAERADHRP